MRAAAGDTLAAAAVLGEASRALVRLHRVRWASQRTRRRMAGAVAVMVAAAGLVAGASLAQPAYAATPSFTQFRLGLTNAGVNSSSTFADLDAFIGERLGDTLFFENAGSSAAPAFAAVVLVASTGAAVTSLTHGTRRWWRTRTPSAWS